MVRGFLGLQARTSAEETDRCAVVSYAVIASRNARLGRPQQVEDLGHARGHVTGIQDWLERLGLEKYAAVFAEHEITLEVLPDLTEADIDRLALPTGPRRRLMIAVEALGAATRAQRPVQPPDAVRRHRASLTTPSGASSP